MRYMLTPKKEREIEELWDLRREAVRLLDQVVAEWKSDPMSVQCFDLRLVERAKYVTERVKKLDVFNGDY
jgi:hypothetical protein